MSGIDCGFLRFATLAALLGIFPTGGALAQAAPAQEELESAKPILTPRGSAPLASETIVPRTRAVSPLMLIDRDPPPATSQNNLRSLKELLIPRDAPSRFQANENLDSVIPSVRQEQGSRAAEDRVIFSTEDGITIYVKDPSPKDSGRQPARRYNYCELPVFEDEKPPYDARNIVKLWNDIALTTNAIDYLPLENFVSPDPNFPGVQYGPPKAARAMAMVHLAMFEALNAIEGKYQSLIRLDERAEKASKEAAITYAAYKTLEALYPPQASRLECTLKKAVATIKNPYGAAWRKGRKIGRIAAAAIIADRGGFSLKTPTKGEAKPPKGAVEDTPDQSSRSYPEPQILYSETGFPDLQGSTYTPSRNPGEWDVDPISRVAAALGARWSDVPPFVLYSPSQFRPGIPPPPDLNNAKYAEDYDEVRKFGSEYSMWRTVSKSTRGIFWSYDGTPGLCAPPRLYNQIALEVSEHGEFLDAAGKPMATPKEAAAIRNDALELARYLAWVNVAMADAASSAWSAKFAYRYWRPITGIRWGKAPYEQDANWMPLGAQTTNTRGPNITPPFPAYPSGHAVFGGAVFEVIRLALGNTDRVRFDIVSDEFNGINKDASGWTRPHYEFEFDSLSEAEEDNAESRIWLGVHWRFDAEAGTIQGNEVGRYVFCNSFRPIDEEMPPEDVCGVEELAVPRRTEWGTDWIRAYWNPANPTGMADGAFTPDSR